MGPIERASGPPPLTTVGDGDGHFRVGLTERLSVWATGQLDGSTAKGRRQRERHLLSSDIAHTLDSHASRLLGSVASVEITTKRPLSAKSLGWEWGMSSAKSKPVPRNSRRQTVKGQSARDFFTFDKGALWTHPAH